MRVCLLAGLLVLLQAGCASTISAENVFHDTLKHSSPPVLIENSAFVEDAKRAVDSLYNLQYDVARQIFSKWRNRYPNHPLWDFWDGMITWWHILPDLSNRQLDDSLFAQLKRASREAGDVLEHRPDHRDVLLVRALSKGLIARQYANREKWFKSLNQARHAINALNKLEKLQIRMPDLMLGRGLLEYYAAYLPEAYPLIRAVSWMLPSGDKQKGLKLMKRAADSSIYMRPEAQYFLGKIYMNHEQKPKMAFPYMKKLYEQYPQNPYYACQYVRALVQANLDSRALRIIEQAQELHYKKFESAASEELLAWKGYILYQRRNLERAEKNLLDSYLLATSKNLPEGVDRPFHVMAGYYLGRVYEAKGDTAIAVRYYRSVQEADPVTSYSKKAGERAAKLD